MKTNQTEITRATTLHDDRGYLTTEGWARFPYWKYDRNRVHASWFRIKEWDYYYVLSPDLKRGVSITFSDLGYIGLMALCWLDFENNSYTQVDDLVPLTRGKLGLVADPDQGSIHFKSSKLELSEEVKDGKRTLRFSSPVLETKRGEKGISGSLVLTQPSDLESINIATSWAENRKAFYYNRKINCMPAEGDVTVGSQVYRFSNDRDSGTIDWGRGNWTYRNRWYWSSCSGKLNGNPFGFNLGYGFSDRTPASENAVFYKNKLHKLAEVEFHFDTRDYMLPWTFTSSDGRLDLSFEPCLDRASRTNFLVLKSVQHQVFGYFSGKIILDDGEVLRLDRFLGFAEDVLNWW